MHETPRLIHQVDFKGLLKSILEQSWINNWVDIEYMYYHELIRIYKEFEARNVERNINLEGNLLTLNKSFDFLKNQFTEYLYQIDLRKTKPIHQISSKISQISEYYEKLNSNSYRNIFVVFNYTETLKLYSDIIDPTKDHIIYIHGNLFRDDNPIIFGYGDETDIYYERIERLNLNSFTKNFKSFKYNKCNNYKVLFNLIKNKYEVVIIGHSCGISDRVLLKEIFNPVNCSRINIYHHKRPDGSTDFEEKTQEISRHFPAHLKHQMRTMVYDLGPLVE